jgi:hypothetical protein
MLGVSFMAAYLSLVLNELLLARFGINQMFGDSSKSWLTYDWFTGHCNCFPPYIPKQTIYEVSTRSIRKRTDWQSSVICLHCNRIYLPEEDIHPYITNLEMEIAE